MTHNILFIESGGGWGGSSSYLYSFLKYLDRDKFNPVVFFYRNREGPFVDKIRALGIKVFYSQKQILNHKDENILGKKAKLLEKMYEFFEKTKLKSISKLFLKAVEFPLLDIFIIVQITRIIKNEKIQLIFLNNDLNYHVPGVLAAKLVHIPCVCRKAGIGGGRIIKKLLSWFVDTFIAISNAAAEDLIQNKFPCKKMVMVYGGIDIEKFKPSYKRNVVRRELGIHQDAQVVGTISQIDIGKGHSDFIEATSLVLKECPHTMFLIVGEDVDTRGGILRKQLQQQIVSVGLEKNVIFTGWRTDVPDVLSAIDIYVQPSVYPEGLCIATLEAQGCGKPAVVTKAGGLAETIADGITGFVVPVGDSSALAKHILRLLKDKKLAIAMVKKAQDRVKKNFDIRRNVKQAEQLCLGLLVCPRKYVDIRKQLSKISAGKTRKEDDLGMGS